MRRSVRPKSAKGKPRPTPPNHPHSSNSTSVSSYRITSNDGSNQYSNGRLTKKEDILPKHGDVADQSKETDTALIPSSLPEISRPVSSLSRYNILPQIPSTPSERDLTAQSPVGSEFELDLMSSFAQQMILDSTRMDHRSNDTAKADKQPSPPKALSGHATRRQNRFHTQGSPAQKKSRTTATRSVFAPSAGLRVSERAPAGRTQKTEPAEGEQRLKLAIKLPDGKRVERYFSPTSSINDVMTFAQTKMRTPVKHCEVYSMLQVPKVRIKSWKLTLEQLQLRDRTMLYIEEKD